MGKQATFYQDHIFLQMKVDNITVARNLYLVLLFDGGNYLSIVVMVSSNLPAVQFAVSFI
jgi:hypothetical protein